MPGKNSRKIYLENTFYHIYNRGVEKRQTFMDAQDYAVFLSYIKQYLLPKGDDALLESLSNPNISPQERDKIIRLLRLNNFFNDITLLAHCLMPNHFHFLIHQKNINAIDRFMNSLGTRYTMYFNKRYDRVGKLWQGVYKAVQIETDAQLLELTRYIHIQALNLKGVTLKGDAFSYDEVQPSSYLDYVGKRKTEWVHPEEILKFFSKTNPKFSYKSFIKQKDEDFSVVQKLILEDD